MLAFGLTVPRRALKTGYRPPWWMGMAYMVVDIRAEYYVVWPLHWLARAIDLGFRWCCARVPFDDENCREMEPHKAACFVHWWDWRLFQMLLAWDKFINWVCRPVVWSPPTVSCEHTLERLSALERDAYQRGFEYGHLVGCTDGRRGVLEELLAYSRSVMPANDVEVVGRGPGQ